MKTSSRVMIACAVGMLAFPVLAAGDIGTSLSLRGMGEELGLRFQEGGGGGGDVDMTLSGPYFLRSADPEEAGEIELKFIYGFEKLDDGEGHEFELELEWGLTEDLEFILSVPFVLGEGEVEGNGDITEFGFHVRHHGEANGHPAVATRHLIRIPTGHESDGIDYTGRALFTWTLVSDSLRLHLNPFLKSINGNLEEDTRRFQWGAAIGIDYWATDNLRLVADYKNFSSESYGVGNQHSIELGADWEIGEGRTIGLQTEFGIDGDDYGADFGVRIAYIAEIQAQ